MKKKYYIKDLNEKQAIHVPTRKTAEKLCEKFHELGLEWSNGDSYLENDEWLSCKGATCYCPASGFIIPKRGAKRKTLKSLLLINCSISKSLLKQNLWE